MRRARLLLLVLPLAGTTILAGCLAPAPRGTAIVVTAGGAEELAFTPSLIQAKVGAPVTIELKNAGTQPHTLTNHDYHVHTGTVQPRGSADATFTPTRAGTFTFLCDLPGHAADAMQVTLEVS
ncbi:MAG: cupredoxin domain-containing protein [Candidatus Thermoplasmatota archaeon]